jgi:quinol monooxygenase YgiN
MSNQLTLIAFAKAKPGHADELGRRLNALVAPTRAEAGCVNYDLHQSKDDPTIWMLYENWRSEADLEKHFQTTPFKEFVARSHEVLANEMDLRRFTMTTTSVAPQPNNKKL